MDKSDIKVVKGINIAIIVLSLLSVLLIAVCSVLLGIGIDYVEEHGHDSEIIKLFEEVIGELGNDVDGEVDTLLSLPVSQYNHGLGNAGTLLSASYDALWDVAIDTAFILACAVLVFAFIANIFMFVAGLIALRRADKPEKLGAAFAWSIVGIVLAVLNLSLILLVLFIISLVYIIKLRKQATTMEEKDSSSTLPKAVTEIED